MPIYLEKQTQIKALLFDKTPIIILVKYSNYNDIFLINNTAKLLKHTKINDHAIKLKKNKLLSFGLIYSLELVELETLKTYIKINLTNSYI